MVVTTVVRTTPSSTGVVKGSSKGFFDNTGAVAGTFSVVGLIGLGILIFIITTVIRRRRAEKFDEDVALAAAEAAATAHNPDFDDYGYSSSNHGVTGYGYADTYHQDPVTFPPTREAYNMSEVGGTGYADTTAGTGGGPGAAGIGAGVLYRSKSGKNQPDPYHAYAVHNDPAVPQNPANMRHRNPGQGQWEDPSLVGGGYDVARRISQPLPAGGVARQKSVQSTNPAPSQSSHYSTDPLTHDPYSQPPPIPESYLDRYRAGTDPENHEAQERPLSTASTADAYGGVIPGKPLIQQPSAPQQPGNSDDLLNPFDGQPGNDRRLSDASRYSDGSQPDFGNDEPRMSLRDDEDYGAGRRVLKVGLSTCQIIFSIQAHLFFPYRWRTNKLIPPRSCGHVGTCSPNSNRTSCLPLSLPLLLLLTLLSFVLLVCFLHIPTGVVRWSPGLITENCHSFYLFTFGLISPVY